MKTYSKPSIVNTVAAAVVVKGGDKFDEALDNIVGTSPAYEADE